MAVDVGSAVGYLDLDISGFLAGLKSAQSEADSATRNMATTIGNNIQGVGKSLTTAGKTLTATVTTPVVGLGTAIVKTSADFESSMSKVSAISGATGSDLDTLKDKAREMGAKTKFSATESAEAFQYMAMAGWKTQDMIDGIDGIMNLAAADGLDLATTSDIVTDALTAFGLSASDSAHFADVLAKASSSANTNVTMLGESFKYAAPVAGALGYSAEDTAIALGLMANSGIKASQGGTALRTMLTNLAKPTDDIAAAMDYLGISLENSDGSMKSLMEVMRNLRSSFGQCKMPMDEFQKQLDDINTAYESGEMTEKQYNDALADLTEKAYGAEGALKAKYAATIAGKEGMSGLLAIVGAADSDFDGLADSIYNADGAAEQMANTMLGNLSGQITILMSSLQELALQFGEIVLPYVKKFVDKIQELVTKFQELSPEQKDQIVKWAALAAAVGPVLLVVGKLLTSVGSIVTTFGKIPGAIGKAKSGFAALTTGVKNLHEGFVLAKAGFPALGGEASKLGAALGGVTAPMVAIVAAIAVLIGAFATLWKTNEGFRNKMAGIWNGIKETVSGFCDGIVERINALGFDFENITEVLKSIWFGFCDLLAPVFEGAFQSIANIIESVLGVITGILDVFIGLFTGNWEQMWTGVKEVFGSIWDGMVSLFENFVNTLTGILDAVCGWFGTTWEETWSSIKQFFVDTWNGIVDFFAGIVDWIVTGVSNFVTSVVTFFQELPSNIVNFITEAYNAVVEWVTNMVSKAIELGSNFLNSVVVFFEQLPYNIGYVIGSVLGSIVKWVTDMVAKAKELGQKFIEAVVSFFQQLPGKVSTFVTNTFNNVKTWAANMIAKAKEMATNFLNSIVSFFKQLPGKVLGFITTTLNNVKTWGTNMVNTAKSAATNFLNNVSNTIKQLPGKVAGYMKQIISNVTQWARDMGTKAREGAQNMFNNVKNGLANLPSTVLSIGKDIVQGLWNGISDAAGWLYDKVKSFASGILDGIKGALGINSPSRVMRDQVGKWLPPGIGEGFEAALPDTMKNIKEQFNASIDKLRGKLHTLQVKGAKFVGGVDFDPGDFYGDSGEGFDYETMAWYLAEVLKKAPIQVPVNVEMKDGDVYMDKERVGRKVAPVVSRVVAQGTT